MQGNLILSRLGRLTAEGLELAQSHFLGIEIPCWAVMPNHIHMIVEILDFRTSATSETNPHHTGEVSSPHAPDDRYHGLSQKVVVTLSVANSSSERS